MKVLMVGVDSDGKGGMLTVVENYLRDHEFCEQSNLVYVPTASAGSILHRLLVFAKGLARIRKELCNCHYDIVHMHLSERGSLLRKNIVQNMAKKAGCKTILHMHGADFEEWYRSCGKKLQTHIRKVISKADLVLILGHYWESFIGGLMTDPDRMVVLHNAVPVPPENCYNAQNKNIMFMGALIERKGILDLLEALSRVRGQLPRECRLILCGDDPDGIAAPAIERLDLDGIVEMTGWLDNASKEKIMAESAINVLPSYREGLPMTILETMANGVPNISARVAAIPEAIDDGENGLLIEAGDVDALSEAILRMLGDAELRKRFSHAGWRKMYEQFSLEAHNKRLLAIYSELM